MLPNELGDDAEERFDPFPTREAPVVAEVKWWERLESKELTAAERVCLDGKEDLRNTPVIISNSTAMQTRNETEREERVFSFLFKKKEPCSPN